MSRAASALVVEKIGVSVVSSNVRVSWRSACPAQRSTTVSPASTRVKRAPSSSPAAKLAAKASFTAAYRLRAKPAISTILDRRLLVEARAAVVLRRRRIDGRDARCVGPLRAGCAEGGERFRRADGQHLDAAVGAVSDPAGDPQRAGLSDRPPAVADALHPARDHQAKRVARHAELLVRG